ncbi:type II secretion system F family protein [Ammonicoccus fulvus]|uniref:Type II secretion system F family protein n=1 Tax=Ammonicoccus fulvus TaxID=3138240 RepID=A0ABZ3FPP4_9ACTN
MLLLALISAAGAAHLAWAPVARSTRPRRDLTPPTWLAARSGAPALRTRVILGGIIGLATVLLGESLGVLPALLLGAGVAAAVVVLLGRIEPSSAQKAREQRILDLPHALELLAGCLASGLPLRRAVREVSAAMTGPIGDDLRLVIGQVDIGVDERQAWLTLEDSPGWTGIARDIARAAESGSGLRLTLDRHAVRARKVAHTHRQARARTVGVRSVLPLMVCFLPAFVLIGIVPTVGSMIVRFMGNG